MERRKRSDPNVLSLFVVVVLISFYLFIHNAFFFSNLFVSDRRYVYDSFRDESVERFELAKADRQGWRVSAHCKGARHTQGVGFDEARRRQRQARNRVDRHDRLHDALRAQVGSNLGSQGCILHALRGSFVLSLYLHWFGRVFYLFVCFINIFVLFSLFCCVRNFAAKLTFFCFCFFHSDMV